MPRNQTRIFQITGADNQVIAAFNKIYEAIIQRHIHRQPRMQVTKLGDRIGQNQVTRDGRHRHFDVTADVFAKSHHRIQCFLSGLLHIFSTVQQCLACLSQGQFTRCSIQ
ncbi:Uncharacterised protein [Vibrio cholerae]|uniref:Uncharacterized protein n=1 Tax=Vibrio cholerae TaxID=666 RepID=A0A655YKF8_VIBCL|nr:Uncharacterised protein [Vibrio cholerae]